MNKIKTIIKAILQGKLSEVIESKLFLYCDIKRQNRIIKARKDYWTNLAKKRLDDLSKIELEQSEYERAMCIWGGALFHKFYKASTGIFDERYFPDDVYYTEIDPYFSDWELGCKLDNKVYYRIFFPHLKQPKLVGFRRSDFWYDGSGKITTKEIIFEAIENSDRDLFVKKATLSMGGHGIAVVSSDSDKNKIACEIEKLGNGDIVIQEGLEQSDVLSKLNDSSVNTIRIMTFLRRDGSVKVCSSILRMGLAGSRVDNASSGGITVGIRPNGQLNKIAYSPDGKSFLKHPTSEVDFDSIVIPNFDKVISMVTNEAPNFPEFRLISWDIAIDKANDPVLIEANLYVGELEFHQLNNGPLFGDETGAILEEIKNNPKKIRYVF